MLNNIIHVISRNIVLSVVFALMTTQVQAGSYEDFFKAIDQDDAKVVKQLISKGFDVNTPGSNGMTPLNMAIISGSKNTIPVLLASPDIDVNVQSDLGETPIMHAANKGDVMTVSALIAKGAEVNKTGWTPLHYAAGQGDVKVLKVLLDAHAYIDAESPNATTPLMMAARNGQETAVTFLLSEGADPTLTNQPGLTAAAYAKRAGRIELSQTLQKASVAFNLKYRNFK